MNGMVSIESKVEGKDVYEESALMARTYSTPMDTMTSGEGVFAMYIILWNDNGITGQGWEYKQCDFYISKDGSEDIATQIQNWFNTYIRDTKRKDQLIQHFQRKSCCY